MATTSEFSDTNNTKSVNIFADMRTELDQKFAEFDSLLKEHKNTLQLKIDKLELEFNNKHKQIEKDKQILIELHQQTESNLAQESLVEQEDTQTIRYNQLRPSPSSYPTDLLYYYTSHPNL